MRLVGSSSHLRRQRVQAVLAAAGLLFAAPGLWAAGQAKASRVPFANSIRAVSSTAADSKPSIVRNDLTNDELSEILTVEVGLKMHNFSELQTRVANGEVVGPAVLAARYYPTPDEEAQVVSWLTGAGLQLSHTDANHLSVFVKGTVSQLAGVFGVQFARVASGGREFSSAISSPSVPAEVSGFVAGIHGLQPHIRLHPMAGNPEASGSTGYLPSQILEHFN